MLKLVAFALAVLLIALVVVVAVVLSRSRRRRREQAYMLELVRQETRRQMAAQSFRSGAPQVRSSSSPITGRW